MEYWDLFDQDACFVGRHLRGEVIPKGLYHNIVSIFTINSKKEILLTQRDPSKSYPCLWENTAGSVLAGEEIITAAKRELQEETGIVCQEKDLIYLGYQETSHKNGHTHAYLLKKDIGIEHIILQKGETIDAKWLPFDSSLLEDDQIARPVKWRMLYFWKEIEGYLPDQKRLTPWLSWANQLMDLSQAGLAYSKDPFDLDRFHEILRISNEMIQYKTGISIEKVRGLFSSDQGYQTPKLSVRVAIFKKNQILLVQENNGLWTLPGGWCDKSLSLKENAKKECLEEAGVEAEITTLVYLEDRKKHHYPPNPYHIYEVFLLARSLKENFHDNIETQQAKYFFLEDLPPLEASKTRRENIMLCYEAYQQEVWKTKFD